MIGASIDIVDAFKKQRRSRIQSRNPVPRWMSELTCRGRLVDHLFAHLI